MTILLDVTALMRRQLTGIGVYVANLVAALGRRPDVELDCAWKLSRFRGRDLLKLHLPRNCSPYIPLLSDLNLHGYDILHGPDFRLPPSRRYRKVVTIHDLVVYEDDLVDPRFAAEGREKLRRMIEISRPDRIITVSEFTRSRLIEIFPGVEPITKTVYLGIDHLAVDERRGSPGEILPALDGPYVLAAGTVEKRKNLERTIDAFEMVHAKVPEIHMVIAGGGGHGSDAIERRIAASPCRDAIHPLGFVSDPLLAALYREALCLTYPSLYEGFGIPILEAMACGCPVITSNRGAMAEIGGDSAILVDPLSAEAIAAAILLLAEDGALRRRYADAGRARATRFTWDRCAEETVQVYRNALE